MSQKKESPSADKWRDIAEQDVKNEADEMVDDAHLLGDEADMSIENTSDKKLTDQLNLLEKQIDSYKDQVARAQAEVENSRRRMEQEVAKARKFGVERLVSDLVPVLDSLTRATDGVSAEDLHVKAMHQGIELTLDLLHNLLEKNGIVKINPAAGDVFDPTQHEAMSMRPDPNAKANTVLQVLQQGYALHGRVIRAAMVIVAA